MSIQGKNLFLTWPQCETTKEQILENALAMWPDMPTYCIAQEEHKDGGMHIHAYFVKPDFTRVTYKELDEIGGKRGNYQRCRSPKNVMQYVIKEDKNWLANFDVVSKIAAMTSKRKYIGTELLLGKRKLTDLVDEDPAMLYDLPHWHRALHLYKLLKQPKRNHKMEIIVVWGTTDKGKSRWAMENYPDNYRKPDGMWWDCYDNEETVIIEEFKGQIPWHQMLELCDRYPLLVPIKGGHCQFNSKRIIFTSNFPWEEWYPDVEDTSPLKRRITKVIHMDSL